MTNKKEVFNFKWDDPKGISHDIGMLAQDGEDFYIMFKPISDNSTEFASGYRGVPGFVKFSETEKNSLPRIYKSNTMFDFFIRRLEDKKTTDPMSDLIGTKGISMVDSFYLSDDIPKEYKLKYVRSIKRAYKAQERLNKLKSLKEKKIPEKSEKSE